MVKCRPTKGRERARNGPLAGRFREVVLVARPRRLRSKLLLGLGLVVGSVALLLGGTLYGIRAYYTTVRVTERKMYELQLVNILIETLKGADTPEPSLEALRAVEAHLVILREEQSRSVAAGLDPDDGDQERGLLEQLGHDLEQLQQRLHELKGSPRLLTDGRSETLGQHPHLRSLFDHARRCAEHLRLAIIHDIETSTRLANRTIRQSQWVVGIAATWAVVLVLTLLYYFRIWMFAPIRQLQAGVQRVHAGDFSQPIRLHSGDELQELADEFNAMTARLAAVYADLARQVDERSRQLVRSERMVSVGFLAAGVAHEINNPLASILFCAEALERRLHDLLAEPSRSCRDPNPSPVEARSATIASADDDREVVTRYLRMIQQEALRCKEITQKLLDFSRSGDRQREPTDLGTLIRGVLEMVRHLPHCRGKQIVFEPTEYVVAPVHAQDLKSVVLNLVVNALESMDEGGRLTITLSARGDWAEMVFTDTGCGMTPEVLANLFEPFFTKSRTGKGTGLGLFISHQIIDQHGGTITASSPGPGLGSTFTVRLPLRQTLPGAEPTAPPATPRSSMVLPPQRLAQAA
ncbi:MAG: HAMP domain-containing histidine kinase [Gemmataceae bacterium]|nr:HAMP domain-containing histidine kinase [Gemmataceae bacterium]